jgi:hypothetical protein
VRGFLPPDAAPDHSPFSIHLHRIYACFVPNPQKGKEHWKFETFAMAGIRGKDGYGKLLTNYFKPLP